MNVTIKIWAMIENKKVKIKEKKKEIKNMLNKKSYIKQNKKSQIKQSKKYKIKKSN